MFWLCVEQVCIGQFNLHVWQIDALVLWSSFRECRLRAVWSSRNGAHVCIRISRLWKHVMTRTAGPPTFRTLCKQPQPTMQRATENGIQTHTLNQRNRHRGKILVVNAYNVIPFDNYYAFSRKTIRIHLYINGWLSVRPFQHSAWPFGLVCLPGFLCIFNYAFALRFIANCKNYSSRFIRCVCVDCSVWLLNNNNEMHLQKIAFAGLIARQSLSFKHIAIQTISVVSIQFIHSHFTSSYKKSVWLLRVCIIISIRRGSTIYIYIHFCCCCRCCWCCCIRATTHRLQRNSQCTTQNASALMHNSSSPLLPSSPPHDTDDNNDIVHFGTNRISAFRMFQLLEHTFCNRQRRRPCDTGWTRQHTNNRKKKKQTEP